MTAIRITDAACIFRREVCWRLEFIFYSDLNSPAGGNGVRCSAKSRGVQEPYRHTEISAVNEIEQVDAKVKTIRPDAEPLN